MTTLTTRLFTNADISVNQASPAIDTLLLQQLTLELQWSGTPTGTFVFEGSNLYDPIQNPSALFLPLATNTFAPTAIVNPAGSAGGNLYALNASLRAPRYIRVRYTATGGAGTLNGGFFGRG